MKLSLAAAGLLLACTLVWAEPPVELTAIEEKYDRSKLGHDETARQEYVMDLARLRFNFIAKKSGGLWWKWVDAEIIRHPAPPDTAIFSSLRLGVWHSPRHDYTYKANGTWKMTDGGTDDPAATHGLWSIKGNRYTDYVPGADSDTQPYTLILADNENFIFTDGTHLFFEKRTLGKGLPLRRDGT